MLISALAVKRPITTLMMFIALMTMGWVAYRQLPVQMVPDITFPMIQIYGNSELSAEEHMENITKPVEGLVAELPGVKRIRSRTGEGWFRVYVEFSPKVDIQYTLVDLQEKLTSFQQSLDDRRTFIDAFPFSTSDWQRTYMYLSVRGEGDTRTLFNTASDKVEQQLQSIDGVAAVNMRGLTAEVAEVQLNTDLVSSYGLELGQIISRVQQAAAEDAFLGELDVPGERHYVRLDDRITTVDELANLTVDTQGIVKLKDVAEVTRGEAVRRWISRQDGYNSIRISMDREAGRNLIELARATRLQVEEINQSLPPGVELTIDEDLAKYVEDAIAEVRNLAAIGACLALFVPLIFFRSFRVALIIFLSVPISLITVFNLFLWADMSINVLSIIGLALGVGMLVDNSIVVTENAFRLFGQGASPKEAAAKGGVEVGRGLFAATLTTVIVFLPMVFQESELKQILKEPALALVFPLFVSLMVALSLAPVFISVILRTYKRQKKGWGKIGQVFLSGYRTLLKSAIRHRAGLISVIAVVLAFTYLEGWSTLRQETTSREPERDSISFEWRPQTSGGTLEEANRAARGLEARLREHPHLDTFWVGFNSERGWMWARLKDKEERPGQASYREIRETMFDTLGPIANVEMSFEGFDVPSIDASSLSLGNKGIIELKGLDHKTLVPYANRLIELLRTTSLITDAELEQELDDPVYEAHVDRERTRLFGITAQQLARYAASTRSSGTISSLQLEDGDRRIDVNFVIEDVEGGTLDDLKELPVSAPGAGVIPFGDLVEFRSTMGDDYYRRTDRQESIDVEYYYERGADQGALKDLIKEVIAAVPNPGGVVAELGGDARRIDQREQDFMFLLLVGLLFVYIVMAAVFESFWVPFTIIATNPLMLIGIVWGLNISGLPLDDMAYFGILLLVGLAVNNGIVMMDRALELQRQGRRRVRAVFEASITRLRPVMMTWATTVLGLMPLALVGESDDQWRPLAVVIIGGLTSATILTLVVLPCFYLIGDDFVAWVKPPLGRFFRVIGELIEGSVNIIFHPIAVWRGDLPFAPSFWPFIRATLRAGWQGLSTPLSIVIGLPGDLYHTVRVFFKAIKPSRRQLLDPSERKPSRLKRLFDILIYPIRWSAKLIARPFVLLRRRLTPSNSESRSAKAGRILLWPLLLPVQAVRKSVRFFTREDEVEPDLFIRSGESAVSLVNIHVIFPPEGLLSFAGWLPARLKPARWQSLHGYTALDGIHLTMEKGLYGILGPNGAGKTTLLRALTGLREPERGAVRIFGTSQQEARQQLAPLIGYLPQNHGIYENLTLYEYLNFFALLTARTLERAKTDRRLDPLIAEKLENLRNLTDPRERHLAILDAAAEVNLSNDLDRKLGTFSGGMKQRAGIARILLQSPPILVVDEPTAGLDPEERVRLRLLISRLAETRLVILSTHIVEDLERGCDRLCLLDRGRVIFEGAPDELRNQWRGAIWDLDGSEPNGYQLLFHVAEEKMRIVTRETPHGQASPVDPSLEDALLASLQRKKPE